MSEIDFTKFKLQGTVYEDVAIFHECTVGMYEYVEDMQEAIIKVQEHVEKYPECR